MIFRLHDEDVGCYCDELRQVLSWQMPTQPHRPTASVSNWRFGRASCCRAADMTVSQLVHVYVWSFSTVGKLV